MGFILSTYYSTMLPWKIPAMVILISITLHSLIMSLEFLYLEPTVALRLQAIRLKLSFSTLVNPAGVSGFSIPIYEESPES